MASNASIQQMIRDMRREAKQNIRVVISHPQQRELAKATAALVRAIAIGEAVAKDRGLDIPRWNGRNNVTDVLDRHGLTSEYEVTIKPRQLKAFEQLVTDADAIHARGLGITLE